MFGSHACCWLALLLLGFASAPRAQEANAPPCGTIVLFDRNVPADNVYPVGVIDIDGRQPFRGRNSYALTPGKHVLKVGAKAPQGELSFQVQRSPDRGVRNRSFEIEVQPDRVYVIAALFDPEQDSDPKAYWKPVVLEEVAGVCKP